MSSSKNPSGPGNLTQLFAGAVTAGTITPQTSSLLSGHLGAVVIAGAAGVLYVWFNGRISPGTIGVSETIGILVIAVVGGLRHPLGPFIGAALYVVIKTFAIDLVGANRFNTLIGLVFLIIVFASPDGILGLWRRLAPHLAVKSLREI